VATTGWTFWEAGVELDWRGDLGGRVRGTVPRPLVEKLQRARSRVGVRVSIVAFKRSRQRRDEGEHPQRRCDQRKNVG
jgi:hypothetical protein